MAKSVDQLNAACHGCDFCLKINSPDQPPVPFRMIVPRPRGGYTNFMVDADEVVCQHPNQPHRPVSRYSVCDDWKPKS